MTPKPPPRHHLTFGELLERWQWSAADLQHAIASGDLCPSVWVGPLVGLIEWQRSPFGDMFTVPVDETGKPSPNDQASEVITARWAYLRSEQTGTGGPIDQWVASAASLERDAPIEEGAGFPEWVSLDTPMQMKHVVADAVFLIPEVEEYEASHGSPSVASHQPEVGREATSPAPIKKQDLIDRNRRRWPSIERDIKDGAENGLSQAARATAKGCWYEANAINWARARAKLSDAGPPESINEHLTRFMLHKP